VYRFGATFTGRHAEERAREYAAWVSAPAGMPCKPVLAIGQERAADNGVWCSAHGGRIAEPAPAPGYRDGVEEGRREGRERAAELARRWDVKAAEVEVSGWAFARCAAELRGASGLADDGGAAPLAVPHRGDGGKGLDIRPAGVPAPEPSDPRGSCPRHGAPDPYDQCARCVAAQFPREVERRADCASAKPASVEPWQVWRWIGCEGDITVQEAPDAQGIAALRVGASDCFAERAAVMLSSPGWTFLHNAKPVQILRGQRWRCVGLEALGDLEVAEVATGEAFLYPLGSRDRIRARAADMLALPQWTFVSGPRE
jgi:hypothetical protein